MLRGVVGLDESLHDADKVWHKLGGRGRSRALDTCSIRCVRPHPQCATPSLHTFLKCGMESGLALHISSMSVTAPTSTPWFFSWSRERVRGTNISISSGTLRTILKGAGQEGGGNGRGGEGRGDHLSTMCNTPPSCSCSPSPHGTQSRLLLDVGVGPLQQGFHLLCKVACHLLRGNGPQCREGQALDILDLVLQVTTATKGRTTVDTAPTATVDTHTHRHTHTHTHRESVCVCG